MNYIESVKTKSLGLAVVLTLVFGPLGLFYATITGGIIMTLTPIALLLFLFIGVMSESIGLLTSSLVLIIIFGISYWIICIIWAITATENYNKKAISEAREFEYHRESNIRNQIDNKLTQNNSPKDTTKSLENSNTETQNPTFREWQKENPQCSINDYYRIYGVTNSTTTTKDYFEQQANDNEKSNLYLLLLTGIFALLIVLVALSYDKATKSFNLSNLTSQIGINSDKKDINEQIENVYFGLTNGAYTSQSLSGTTPENLPFYNTDLSTLIVMGFAPLTMISGKFSLEPKNIQILRIDRNEAEVSYDLIVTNESNRQVLPIKMTLKKIGGKWKLDGQKFFPLSHEH